MNVQVRRLTLICSRMWTGARKDTPSSIIYTLFRVPVNLYLVLQLTTSLRDVLSFSFRLLLLVLPFQLSFYHSSSTSFSRRLCLANGWEDKSNLRTLHFPSHSVTHTTSIQHLESDLLKKQLRFLTPASP